MRSRFGSWLFESAAEDADFEGDFQSEVRMLLEPQNQVGVLSVDTLRFAREKPRHRIRVIIGGLKVEETGQLLIESRIKRAGECDWLAHQMYTIDVVVKPPDDAMPAPLEGTHGVEGATANTGLDARGA